MNIMISMYLHNQNKIKMKTLKMLLFIKGHWMVLVTSKVMATITNEMPHVA